jgi:thioredoxin reductase
MLRRRGVDPLIIERSPAVGDSWRRRYDRLHLNTVRWLSDLPGYRMERRTGNYPSRDAFVSYLERYVERQGLTVRFDSPVTRIDRAGDGGGWSVLLADETLSARHVVVATGYDAKPLFPDWPGMYDFAGRFLHAAYYRNSEPFVGEDVLVVGAGNTASDVATDLAEGGAGRVRVSIRTPPNIFPRRFFGSHAQYGAILGEPLPDLGDRIGFLVQRRIYGDLTQYGLPRPQEGMHAHFRRSGHGPMVDEGFVRMVKQGGIEVVPAVKGFDGRDVRLVDGSRIRPSCVVAATGYVRDLEPLVGRLGVLAENGCPIVHGAATAKDAPGLYFIGFVRKMSGQLLPMRGETKQIGQSVSAALKRERRSQTAPGRRPRWRTVGVAPSDDAARQ